MPLPPTTATSPAGGGGGTPPAAAPPATPPRRVGWFRRIVGVLVTLMVFLGIIVGLSVWLFGPDEADQTKSDTAISEEMAVELAAIAKAQALEIARLKAEMEALKRGQPTPPAGTGAGTNPQPQPPFPPSYSGVSYAGRRVAQVDTPEMVAIKRQILELQYKIDANVADGLTGNGHPRVHAMRMADRSAMKADMANLKAALAQAEAARR